MKKEDIEIKYLLYDPFDPKTVSKLESYEEFKEDFGIDKSKVCAYIILMYDMNTQLRREIPYFNQRKLIAAELAGFEFENGKLIESYENAVIGLNSKFNAALSKYVRLFASPKYLSLVYFWSIQAAEYDNVTGQHESKELKSTIDNIEKLEIKINDRTEFLFGGNETTDIKKALYESAEKERLKIRPEDIANMSEEELDEQLGNPYGNGYKPEKLKFLGDH